MVGKTSKSNSINFAVSKIIGKFFPIIRKIFIDNFFMLLTSCRSSNFSRWGGFSYNFWNFSRPFFRSTKWIFWALPNHYKNPILAKFSARQANFSKNRPKAPFESFKGPSPKWISQNTTKGTDFCNSWALAFEQTKWCFEHFLKNLTKMIHYFGARSPQF